MLLVYRGNGHGATSILGYRALLVANEPVLHSGGIGVTAYEHTDVINPQYDR